MDKVADDEATLIIPRGVLGRSAIARGGVQQYTTITHTSQRRE